MKKLVPLFIILTFAISSQAQILKLDTFMYSPSLDTVKMVDVILPPGYNQNLNTYYPVVYYLHGWTGDQNANPSIISYMYSYINSGTIQPFILVKASSWCEPFEGSFYTNSILWGDYLDYITEDLIAWVDSTFRTIPEKNYRGLLGQSMGSYGCLFLPTAHPEYYRAAAGHAGGGSYYHFDSLATQVTISLMGNNPPYYYNYYSSYSNVRAWFLIGGAFSPNPNTSQTYIYPALVDYPFDEYGHIIDSTWDKFQTQSAEMTISSLTPADSVSFLLSCGTQDDYYQFDPMLDLVDTMLSHNLDVEWLPHTGDHAMPTVFKIRALLWLDSLLGDPEIILGEKELAVPLPEYKIWPNPSEGHLTVSVHSTQKNIQAEIFDIEGRYIKTLFSESFTPTDFQKRVDISTLPAGTYLLHLQIGNKHLYDKLIKL